MSTFVCEVCCYPAMHHADACDNPGCYANPSVSQTQKDVRKAKADKIAAEEAERERLRAIRRRVLSTMESR